MKRARGTSQRVRRHEAAVEPIEAPPVMPTWLSRPAQAIWARKLAVYQARRQNIAGLEDALGHYCELEHLLEASWRKRQPPSMKVVTAYRAYARDFYDTPASQQVPAGSTLTGAANPFARNGRRRP